MRPDAVELEPPFRPFIEHSVSRSQVRDDGHVETFFGKLFGRRGQEPQPPLSAVVEFGLGKEFILRLASGKLDPFVGMVGGLEFGELGLFQILFRRARQPWAESVLRALTDNHGDAFFSNAPELVAEARKKVARPLYVAVVRLATQGKSFDRAWEIAPNMAGAFHAFADPLGNELIPLTNDDYPFDEHVEDVLRRRCRRSGMILNSDELIGFVHLPGAAVRSAKLLRETKKTKAAPARLAGREGVLLGQNIHHGKVTEVRVSPSDRVRHMHLFGTSGTGKSTLLLNLIRQDIENGAGVGVLDPHGNLVDDILEIIPPERIKDVVLVDPGDDPLTGNRSIGPVLTRLETFLSPKSIRYMVSQPVNRLDFANILDSGKIFLAKLSQGQIGRENAFLLGRLLVSKFQQTAMSRQRMAQEARRDFWLYIDEFHNFITPSMAEILTGARKYRLGLTLAHQELRQLQRDSEVAGAVMSNTFTRVVFRVGDEDARKLGDGFGYFEESDLQNLSTGQAIARVERSDFDFNLAVPNSTRPDPETAAARRAEVVEASRQRYATPRAIVEAQLLEQLEPDEAPSPTARGWTRQSPTEGGSPSREKSGPPSPSAPKSPGFGSGVTPKPAEPPNSESNATAVPASDIPATSEDPVPMVEPGAGIDDETKHSALRRQITAAAKALDYIVSIEEFVAGTQGRADLVLRRGRRIIACEITVTTDAEQEGSNITKYLNGLYPQVALISTSVKKLENIERRFRKGAESGRVAKVSFYLPADIIAELRKWAATDPRDLESEKRVPRKQSINLNSSKMTPAERSEREREMLAALAEDMKRKPKAPPIV